MINFSVVLLALAIIPTAFLNRIGIPCIWRRFVLPWIYRGHCPETGFFAHCLCPGCGLTRAMSRLMHGDFVGAYSYNHLIFLVVATVLVIFATNVIKLLKKTD
ncbi:MAG: DUF2752 domain-containing protein [Candidatus Berkelbacteria bacterium]|nr:DUF2752 domain-containing protein [Candidatus Berkelbacteria bacterium]